MAEQEKILKAALSCVARLGFEKARIEDIVLEAGVSRATIYRRFKTREKIFETLLVRQAQPFIEQSQHLVMGPGSFRERLSALLCLSLAEVSQMSWLKATLRGGVSPASFAVIVAAQRTVAAQILLPFLAAGLAAGEMRQGLKPDDAATWILRQTLEFGAGVDLRTEEIARLVATYILPVLTPDSTDLAGPGHDVEARLKRLELILENAVTAQVDKLAEQL